MTGAPQQMQLNFKNHDSRKLFFASTSDPVLTGDDLFTFKAVNKDTGKELLVNGKKEFGIGIRKDSKPVHFVISDVKGKS